MSRTAGALDALLSRVSTGALADPGPDDAQLRLMLEAAVRAPDHGKLRPWRFFVIRGEARTRLSELFAASIRRREPAAGEAQIAKERAKPLRSPVTIAVAARVEAGHKIPQIEQILSAGAAAMNILNAAHGLGFGAKWVTGANCYDAEFGAAFGLEAADRLVGFIHIGTALETPETARPDPAGYTTDWPVQSSSGTAGT
jgi:nitroreductase